MRRFLERLQEKLEQVMSAVAFAEAGEVTTARQLLKEPVAQDVEQLPVADEPELGVGRPESA